MWAESGKEQSIEAVQECGDEALVAVRRLRLAQEFDRENGGIGTAPSILRRNGVWTAMPDPRTGGRAAGF